MLSVVLALSLQAQAPTFTLPPGIGTKPATFTAAITVEVGGVKAPKAAKPLPEAQLAPGKKLYAQRCAMCHGDAGAADGAGARRIKPEPQHLNDVMWQSAVTDGEIEKAIIEGGAAVSKSPMMPSNPDLKSKPTLVKSLVAYVRALRAPFGSVTATATAAGVKGAEPVVVRVDATNDGKAKVIFPSLPRGKHAISVMVDESGTVGCTLELDVQKDATVTCPPAKPAK